MSYPVAQPSAARVRPGPVTAAMILLFIYAALQATSTVLTLLNTNPDELTGSDPQAQIPEGFGTGVLIASGVVGVAIAAGFAVLAWLVGRGKNVARIVTWSLGGLFLLCNVCMVGGVGAMSALPATTNSSTGEEVVTPSLADITPLDVAMSVASILLLLVALILLALPASNDFFRKREEVWVPPAGSFGAYPAFPPPPPSPGSWPAPPGTGAVPPAPPAPPSPPAPPPPGSLPPAPPAPPNDPTH